MKARHHTQRSYVSHVQRHGGADARNRPMPSARRAQVHGALRPIEDELPPVTWAGIAWGAAAMVLAGLCVLGLAVITP